VVTRALLVVNVAVFAWTSYVHMTDSDQLPIKYGAFYGPNVAAGEWWRTFTAAFLHGGLLHIGFNMFALWQVGMLVEQLFGGPKMALMYLLSIIGSGWAIYHFNYLEITIGASGAIFGLFGALAAAGLRLGKLGRDLVRGMLGIIILNVIIGFMVPNISQAGHLGGLVAGFLSGLVLYRPPILRPRTIAVDAAHEGRSIEAELLPPEPHDREPPG
jgi:rhomboid protease GluP